MVSLKYLMKISTRSKKDVIKYFSSAIIYVPAIEMELKQVFFFARFKKCIQNEILVRRARKIVKRTNGKCIENNNDE